jgi:hypothetical protein
LKNSATPFRVPDTVKIDRPSLATPATPKESIFGRSNLKMLKNGGDVHSEESNSTEDSSDTQPEVQVIYCTVGATPVAPRFFT